MTVPETASLLETGTPSSTTGSSADSPCASHPPPTPLSPESASLGRILTPTDNESNASSADDLATVPSSIGPAKRKPGRRANTAERRATHNAVERQRRETLNGRFLDLAALLPNLATVRRPSKSAIVNSSIASLHAARRTRLLAARELRLLHSESDSLRLELNEWRVRAGLPRVDEPTRSHEFHILINPQETDRCGSTEGHAWELEGLEEMGEEERKAYQLALQDRDEDATGDDGYDDNASIKKTLTGPVSATAAGAASKPLGLFHRQQQQAPLSLSRDVVYNEAPLRTAFSASEPMIYGPSNHHSFPVQQDFAVQAQMNQNKLACTWSSHPADIFFAQMQTPPWAPQLPSANHSEHKYIAIDSGEEIHVNPALSTNQYFVQQHQLSQQRRFYAPSEQSDSSSVGSIGSVGNVGSVDSNILAPDIVRSLSSSGANSDSFEINTINGRPAFGHRKASYSLSVLGSNWATQGSAAIVSAGGGTI